MNDWLESFRPHLSAQEKDDLPALSATKQKIIEILSQGQTTLSTLHDETGLSYSALETELVELKRLGLAMDGFTVDTDPVWVWR